jgi:hypothetical protein
MVQTANGNILLTLKAKAESGSFQDLAAFGGFIKEIGKFLLDAVGEAEEFSKQLEHLKVDISGADKATKGLVDTTQLMANANKLSAAGLSVTAKEYESLNKFVVATAQSMGKDATQATTQFMRALATGRTTTLKEFGIDVKAGKTNLETFGKVMNVVTERSKNMEVRIERTSDRIFIFKNHAGTAAGQLWKMAGNIEIVDVALNKLNKTMGEFSKALAETEDVGANLGDFFISMLEDLLKGMKVAADFITKNDRFKYVLTAVGPLLGPAGLALSALVNTDAGGAWIDTAVNELMGLADVGMNKLSTWAQQRRDRAFAGASAARKASTQRAEQMAAGAAGAAPRATAGGRRRGGGGRAAGITDDDLLGAAGDEAFLADPLAGLESEELQEEKWQRQLEQKEREKQLQQEHHVWLLENSHEYAMEQFRIEQEAAEQSAQIEEQRQAARRKRLIGGATQTLGDLSSLMQTENKRMFNIGKAAAIANTTIQGILGAQEAFTSLASIPIVGPILGGLAASAALVAMGVNISKIQKTKFGGGGSAGGTSSAFSSIGTGPTVATPPPPRIEPPTGEGGTTEITVMLDSDVLLSSQMRAAEERDQSGLKTFVIRQEGEAA